MSKTFPYKKGVEIMAKTDISLLAENEINEEERLKNVEKYVPPYIFFPAGSRAIISSIEEVDTGLHYKIKLNINVDERIGTVTFVGKGKNLAQSSLGYTFQITTTPLTSTVGKRKK